MKRTMILLAFVLLVAWLPSAHGASDETVLKVPLRVEGMTCIGCVANVKRALEAVPGVRSVKVSLKKNEAVVAYEKDKVTVKQLIQAVEKAGYKASLKEEQKQSAPATEGIQEQPAPSSEPLAGGHHGGNPLEP